MKFAIPLLVELMSSDPSSINADTIEQTKQQIRGLVGEIAQLSKSDLTADQYFPAFLTKVVQALAAVGGAVWLVNEHRRLTLKYQINLSDTLLDSSSEEAGRHLQLLRSTLGSGQSRLVPPLSSSDDEQAGGNPTRFLLVLAPLTADGEAEGIIEVFQRPEAQPATQRGYERFLLQMCELANEWLKSRKLKHFSDRHSLWAQADHFSRLVHESLDLRETAYTIVNEGRRLIGCDRVSLAMQRGRKCVVEAVSGQDTVESRSNIIVSLNELASKVVATGETLWYEGSTEDLPPQLEKAVHGYVDESYAKSMVVMPIRRPKTSEIRTEELRIHEASAERNESNEIVGALIVEQIETDVPRSLVAPRVDLVYEHSARALSNTIAHNSLFLMPIWRAVGSLDVVVKARNLPKTLVAVAVLVLALIGIFLVPTNLMLSADGTLEPMVKQNVFVNVPGTVVQVLVEDQQLVEAEQPLIVLHNAELAVELQRVRGERLVSLQRLASVRDALNSRGLSEDERTKLGGQVLELRESLQSLQNQIELREQQMEELILRSPIAGQVMLSWDVERSLLRRRVEAGQILMAVADPSDEWELELYMPERRMGHVNRARQSIKEDLDVDYILATEPRRRLDGTVRYIDPVSRVHEDSGHSVLIRVDIDESELGSELRPGAKVHARLNSGRCSYGYRWFHEAIAWVQTNLLF
jgi:multidrug efflux pump subunit AcrA (membrane-fusion protein)